MEANKIEWRKTARSEAADIDAVCPRCAYDVIYRTMHQPKMWTYSCNQCGRNLTLPTSNHDSPSNPTFFTKVHSMAGFNKWLAIHKKVIKVGQEKKITSSFINRRLKLCVNSTSSSIHHLFLIARDGRYIGQGHRICNCKTTRGTDLYASRAILGAMLLGSWGNGLSFVNKIEVK